jgi:outer membrane receptor protein involved in Fe transport
MRVEKEILFVPPAIGDFAFGENQNVPEVKHKGADLSGVVRFSEWVRLTGTYSIVRTEITEGPFKGSSLPITPKHAGSVAFHLGMARGWAASVTGRFIGRRILANDLANVQEKLGGYGVVDTRLAYLGEHFEAFFGIKNLFNREYNDFGGVSGFPFGSRVGVNPAPERNYLGGAAIRFQF